MAGGIIGSLMYAVGFKFNSSGLNAADKQVGLLTKSVIGIGTAAAAAGAAMIGIGVAGVKAASEFENAMTMVQNATGSTAEQMEATKGIAKDLYSSNFGEDWNDLGESIASVQQVTGLAGDALKNTTKDALILRNAFGYDVPESVKTANTLMKQFGITSDQAFTLLAQGKQKGLDFSGEMMDSVNEYSNQFKSLGFNANEMFDTLAVGAKNGAFNLDKVGDAVKEFNLRASDGSKTTIQSYQMLGLDADKMMKTFAAGGPAAKKAFTQIAQMIGDVADPVAANTIAVNLFGTQFEDLQKNTITAMGYVNSQFDMTKKTMDDLNKTKFTSLGQVFSFIGRQVEVGFLIPLGQKLLPYLDQFGQWVTSHQPQITALGKAIADGVGLAISKVSGWVQAAIPYLQQFGTQAGQAFGYLIDKGKELWASIQPVVEMIGTKLVGAAVALWPEIQNIAVKMYEVGKAVTEWSGFLPIVSGIAAMLLTYKGAMLAVATATKIAGIATKVWSGITKAFTAVQTAFNAVMAMNPIALVVLALVGLGVALTVAYKRSDKFRAFVDKMWAGIKTATTAVLNFFKVTVPKAFVTAFNAVTGFLKKWGVVLLTVIGAPIRLVSGLVVSAWNKVKTTTIAVFTTVWNWLKNVWNGIKTTVSGAVTAIWGAVKGAFDRVVGVVTAWGMKMLSKILTTWTAIKNAFFTGLQTVWNVIKSGWDKVFSTTNSLMTKIWNKITAIWGQIVSGVKTAGTKLWTAVSDMWGKVTGFFDGINLLETGKKIIQSLIDGISNMTTGLMDKVRGIVEEIKGAFGFKTTASVSVQTDAIIGASGVDGSHANGLAKVPWDGYIAQLHKGERVLTAEENDEYSRYTPETAPARTTNNSSKAEFNPVFNISVQGSADNQTLANLRETIRREMQEVFESYARSAGLDGA